MEFDDQTKIIKKETAMELGERDVGRSYLVVLSGPRTGEMFELGEQTSIGRSSEADISMDDDGVSRIHCNLMKLPDGQVVLRDTGSTNGTFVNGERIHEQVLEDGDKIQIAPSAFLKFTFHDELEMTFREQMYDAALRDSLTRSYNRRYFEERLTTEWSYAMRHGTPLALVMMDLDHFKRVNDTWGHPAGDYVLRTFAKLIMESIRTEDVLCRYGGEEFVVVCREFPVPSAQVMSERLRATVEEHVFQWEGEQIPVTVSIGVAGLPDPNVPDEQGLVTAADEALYEAKHTGRNRVCVRHTE